MTWVHSQEVPASTTNAYLLVMCRLIGWMNQAGKSSSMPTLKKNMPTWCAKIHVSGTPAVSTCPAVLPASGSEQSRPPASSPVVLLSLHRPTPRQGLRQKTAAPSNFIRTTTRPRRTTPCLVTTANPDCTSAYVPQNWVHWLPVRPYSIKRSPSDWCTAIDWTRTVKQYWYI